MPYELLANTVVIIHLVFIVFVLSGGLLLFFDRRFAWVHLPAVLWAALIEFAGWVCPLTPLENLFRQKSGAVGYQSNFIEHYIIPLLYPSSLSKPVQITLGLFVLFINGLIYGLVLYRLTHAKE